MSGRSVPEPYQLVRSLGQGGFGEVFLVRDPQRGDVAIKRLARVEPQSITRFKNEFRLLQGLRHPALAKLYELANTGGGWYLVMEYVPGEHFTAWVRPGGDGYTASTMPEIAGNQSVAGPPVNGVAFDENRLRDALRRLAHGLVALHDGGIIHRDLKPSNVLVAPNGRVVILDFGLAAAPAGDSHQSLEAKLMGTPGYIAPEQARAAPITRAVDWYAVGVMLFEALTGRRPYVGSVRDIIEAQLNRAVPDPLEYGRPVPDDLRALCMRLLAANPADRPEGNEVLALLGAETPGAAQSRPSLPLFVGRFPELTAIAGAVDELAQKGPSVVHIVAGSGLGKSALLVRAIADARERAGAVVLGGRCYEREALPYKAIDPLMDALADHLRRLSTEEVLGVMPRDAFALCRMFPALEQVEQLARAPDPEKVENPDEIRRRAVAALRDLLARIADRKPLVLAIDDMQWSCLDSARLLGDLLASPSPPRLLVMLSYRPQEQSPNAALVALKTRLDASGISQETLALGPLDEADAQAMAKSMLPIGSNDELAKRVARESGQNPLFVAELARAAIASPSASAGLALDAVIAARVDQIDKVARVLLELVAVAARVIELRVVCKAAGVTLADAEAALAILEEGNLLRHGSGDEGTVVESIHDRIREVVVGMIGAPRLVGHHASLADALVELAPNEPQLIAEHFRLAEKPERARPFAMRAAETALETLALDRAIALYRVALAGSTADERFDVLVKLGNALAFDRRGGEAAESFREAIAIAPSDLDAIELKARVAHHLLSSGRIDEGLDSVEEVLTAANLRLASTPRRALVSLLYERFRLKLRGFDFKERKESELSREVLTQIDACWAVSMVLSGVDLVRSADLQSRHLRYALDAGEPYRVSRGLALEAILLSIDGSAGQARAVPILQRAEELAQSIGHPHAMAWAAGAGAVAAWCVGRFSDVVSLSSYSIALLRSRCMEAGWEIGTLEAWFRLRSLISLGEVTAALRDTAAVDEDATARADLYALTTLRTAVSPICRLLDGDPEGAVEVIKDAIVGWSTRGWFFQHQESVRNESLADMYRGNPGKAIIRCASHRDEMKASMMLRMQNQRILLYGLEGVAAVNAAELEKEKRAGFIKLAGQRAAQLQRERNPWSVAVGDSIAARVAATEKTDDAPAQLEAAQKAFAALEMALHTELMKRLRGELIGGDAGKTLVADADRALAGRGVKDPAALQRWLGA